MVDLVDLEEYKEYKEITNTESDARRQSLITYASALVENYCNRKFLEYNTNPLTEYRSALNTEVYLMQFPILTITSVKTSGDGGKTQEVLTEEDTDDTGFYANYEEGIISPQIAGRPFLYYVDHPHKSLEIVYTAGYATLPLDLKLAVFDLVHYYEHEESVITKALDNPFAIAQTNFPAHITRVLNLYRVPYAFVE